MDASEGQHEQQFNNAENDHENIFTKVWRALKISAAIIFFIIFIAVIIIVIYGIKTDCPDTAIYVYCSHPVR